MMRSLMQKYPNIRYLAKKAQKRIPHFAWEFLEGGTGLEEALQNNLDGFSKIQITPQFLKGYFEPDIETALFGVNYSAPFGIAPLGLAGLIWPQADQILAKAAAKYKIPYSLSTNATASPEAIGPLVEGLGWFQLYPPRDKEVRKDLLCRAHQMGFTTLLLTVDVPIPSRRERQHRAGVSVPPEITPQMLFQSAIRPIWAIETLRTGLPQLKTITQYAGSDSLKKSAQFVAQILGNPLSWDYVKATREEWPGKFVLKGILHPEEAALALAEGVDGLMVSNHGARQFDGNLATIEMLPEIVKSTEGKVPIILDSGVRNGLDVLKALALGADFVLLGRAFLYSVAALGTQGGEHAIEIILDEIKNAMKQMGCSSLSELPNISLRFKNNL